MPENKIVKISPADKKFPRLLKEIPDCPKMLYCRGNLDLLNTSCFAVVGTRKLTAYGKEAATKITGALARHFTIVSGLALGIDAIAHRATLDAGGKTIAVLGSGVDDKRIYPSTNFRLAMEITESGGLIGLVRTTAFSRALVICPVVAHAVRKEKKIRMNCFFVCTFFLLG